MTQQGSQYVTGVRRESVALAARPWRPAGFIAGSLALHAGAVIVSGLDGGLWPWCAGAVALDQALISAAGMWPRSRLLGPNWTRLPAAAAARGDIAITLDDGPDPDVTPAVLDVLEAAGARASFFCIGEQARRYPALCRAMVTRGHSVENHSHRHRLGFALSGYRGFVAEVGAAQATLADITGQAPRFFRAPFGIRNPLLEPALCRFGLQLASWTRRAFDTREGAPAEVSRRLLRGLAAGDILLLHDGNAARTPAGRPVILEALPQVLAAARAAGLRPVSLPQTLA